MAHTFIEAYLLQKVKKLEDDLTAVTFAIGTSGGIVSGGTSSPEGSVVGGRVGQIYTQFASSPGGAITRVWSFNGVLGANTGWA